MTRSQQTKSDCPKVILIDGNIGSAQDLKFADFVEIIDRNEAKEYAIFLRLRNDGFNDLPSCLRIGCNSFRIHMLDNDYHDQIQGNGFSAITYSRIRILSHDGATLFPLINSLRLELEKLKKERKEAWQKIDKFLENLLGERPE